MAKIELNYPDNSSRLFQNYCKRTGSTPEQAANHGIENCIQSECFDSLRRLISKGQIPDAVVEESDAGMVA